MKRKNRYKTRRDKKDKIFTLYTIIKIPNRNRARASGRPRRPPDQAYTGLGLELAAVHTDGLHATAAVATARLAVGYALGQRGAPLVVSDQDGRLREREREELHDVVARRSRLQRAHSQAPSRLGQLFTARQEQSCLQS